MAVVGLGYTKQATGAQFAYTSDSNSAAVATVKADVAALVYTTLAAAIATAVADGASPTQAHVTAINTAWGTFKALVDTAVTDAAALAGVTDADVKVSVNTSNITTKNQLTQIWEAFRSWYMTNASFS